MKFTNDVCCGVRFDTVQFGTGVGGTCCFNLQGRVEMGSEGRDKRFLGNVGTYLPNNAVLTPMKTGSSDSTQYMYIAVQQNAMNTT
jgi:hypothetical protein